MIPRSKHYRRRALWALLPTIVATSLATDLRGEDSEASELEKILNLENPALRSVSPDERYLVGWPHAHGQRLLVYSLENKEKLRRFGVEGRAMATEFHPDGKRFAVASGEGNLEFLATIAALSIDQGASRTVGTAMGMVTDLAFSPDGERLAAAFNLNLLGSMAQKQKDDNPDLCVGFVKVWRFADGEELLTIDFRVSDLQAKIEAVLASRTESESDSENGDALMNLYDESSRERMPKSLSFSPDGQRLTVISMAETSALFDATSGTEIPPSAQ